MRPVEKRTRGRVSKDSDRIKKTNLAEEPGDDIAEDNSFVCFVIVGGAWDAGEVPEIALPFVSLGVHAACVEEQDVGSTVDEPSAVKGLDAAIAHDCEGGDEVGIVRLFLIDLHGGRLVGEGADEAVPVAILCLGDGDLCLDDGVDSADLVCDLPGALEEDRRRDVSLVGGHWMGTVSGSSSNAIYPTDVIPPIRRAVSMLETRFTPELLRMLTPAMTDPDVPRVSCTVAPSTESTMLPSPPAIAPHPMLPTTAPHPHLPFSAISVAPIPVPTNSPPIIDHTLPSSVIAPFVPRGTRPSVVINRGCDRDRIPSSDASVSPRQHPNCPSIA